MDGDAVVELSCKVGVGTLAGTYDVAFAGVAAAFEKNFRARDELGASVCVTVDGKTVVDLWGGTAREDTGAGWEKDTLSIVWSSTKGAVSFCIHVLAARGLLDIDAPVSAYWPEFAADGKDAITVKMILNHQSGMCAVSAPLPAGAYADPALMVKALEAQTPYFAPGSNHGYQALTYGWLLGELCRRITGQSLGTFFRTEIAEPLGIDFWIGLPEALEPRTAHMIMHIPATADLSPLLAAAADKRSLQYAVLGNSGGYMGTGADGVPGYDSRAAHGAEIGSAGGMTNGRGLAGIYAPLACGGRLNGIEFVSPDGLARMAAVSSAGHDFTLLVPTRYSLGFFKSVDNRRQAPGAQDSLHMSEAAFGHPGFGGSIGFADPECRMSLGYTMNRMGPGTMLNPRGQSLIDAAYRTLGYRSKDSGSWRR